MINHKLVPCSSGTPPDASGPILKPIFNKLAIKEKNQILFINYCDIVCCEAKKSCTIIDLLNGEKYKVNKSLKNVQEQIKSTDFFRVHASYIANLNHVQRIAKDGEWVITVADRILPVSRSRIVQLKARLGL